MTFKLNLNDYERDHMRQNMLALNNWLTEVIQNNGLSLFATEAHAIFEDNTNNPVAGFAINAQAKFAMAHKNLHLDGMEDQQAKQLMTNVLMAEIESLFLLTIVALPYYPYNKALPVVTD